MIAPFLPAAEMTLNDKPVAPASVKSDSTFSANCASVSRSPRVTLVQAHLMASVTTASALRNAVIIAFISLLFFLAFIGPIGVFRGTAIAPVFSNHHSALLGVAAGVVAHSHALTFRAHQRPEFTLGHEEN